MEVAGTARLTSDILGGRAVSASVSRSQIADVLHEPDGGPELVLDLVAAEGDEHATINMTWSREDLERLLEGASGDEVVLTFDRDELASAFGDVEGHGIRTTAAVFAVAAAGALAGGGAAAHASAVGGEPSGTAATPVAATSTADATAALEARGQALNEEYGLGTAGNAATVQALDARGEALNQEYGLGTAGEAAAVQALDARGAALNQEYGLGTAGEAATVQALDARGAALNQQYGLGASSTGDSSGVTLQRATADDGLLIAGVLLTIAGATFVVRRSAGGRHRPA